MTRADAAVVAGLLLLAAAIYAQCAGFGYVSFDDDKYLYAQPHVLQGLSWEGVRWAFTTRAAANWHPLTWLCLMTEVSLFGTAPGPHHLVGAALHGVNAALVFWLLSAATGDRFRSGLVAALFCAHPMHVESVAWIAERKDLLSTLFGLGSLWAWVRQRKALSLGAFALSLLAKPMLVTLPFVLLLLDFWPLRRPRWLLLEKLPFFALSALSSAMTVLAQKEGGAVVTLDSLPPLLRVENALAAITAYLGKLVFPVGLSYFYPLDVSGLGLRALAAALVVLALTGLCLARARAQPWLLMGWLFFLGTLLPVIGLVQVGAQAYADRYTYVPYLGLFLALAWQVPPSRVAAALALSALSALSFLQARAWRDGPTLYLHALDVDAENWAALANLGGELMVRGKPAQAANALEESVRLHPANAQAQAGLGIALEQLGRGPEARAALERAARLDPQNEQISRDLARVSHASGASTGAR